MQNRNVLIIPNKLPDYLVSQVSKKFNIVWLSDIIENDQWFEKQGDAVELVLTNASSGIDSRLINRLSGLKMIAINGVGFDAVDLVAAKQRKITVTNTPDVLNDCVADHAMALMLGISRRINESERYLRDGKWASQGKFPLGKKLGGKICGIVGLGNIGQAVALRAQAFGMHIHYFSRKQKTELSWPYHASVISLAEVSNYLVITLPGGDDTYHMISQSVLEALGPEGYIVNVSRGSVVDENALTIALENEKIAGAALDVYEYEPQVPVSLLSAENVLLTPHIGSSTHETAKAMADLVVENMLAFSQGKPVLTPVPGFDNENLIN
ncbi:TPA: 2-hydroxyacid dehydrogenase [Klebsiella pneumoniae]|nr:2-hydroxyacid dehydrogenase [Klebsiella pneumoniae]